MIDVSRQNPVREPSILYSVPELEAAERERVAGCRILIPLANSGHVIQETLLPIVQWERAGARVDVVALDGGDVDFDPVCNVMAEAERLWSDAARLFREAKRSRRFCGLPSLREQAKRPDGLARFTRQYDAIAVPGGHGAVFGAFLKTPELAGLLRVALEEGKTVGLECHAVAALAFALDGEGRPLARGRHLTCWPGALEVLCGLTPGSGSYFRPLGTTVEHLLREATHFVHVHASPWRMPGAVIDENLVTGWGPWTTRPFADAVLHSLARTAAPRANVERAAAAAPQAGEA